MDLRLQAVEQNIAGATDWKQDHGYLKQKVTELEDRKIRNNIRMSGVTESLEGKDRMTFLAALILGRTSIEFQPPLEFQRAHRIRTRREATPDRPRQITVCLLRHQQV